MAESYNSQGDTAFTSGQFAQAIQFYSKAIELEPKNHIYYNNRACAYERLGNPQKELEDAQKAIDLK